MVQALDNIPRWICHDLNKAVFTNSQFISEETNDETDSMTGEDTNLIPIIIEVEWTDTQDEEAEEI